MVPSGYMQSRCSRASTRHGDIPPSPDLRIPRQERRYIPPLPPFVQALTQFTNGATPLGNRHLSPFFPPSISPGYAPRRKRWRPAAVLDRRAVTVTDESGDSFCPRGAAAAAACCPAFLFWTRQAGELLHLGHFFLLLSHFVFFLGCYHFACCWLVGGTFVGGEAGGPGGASDGTRRVRLRPLPPAAGRDGDEHGFRAGLRRYTQMDEEARAEREDGLGTRLDHLCVISAWW